MDQIRQRIDQLLPCNKIHVKGERAGGRERGQGQGGEEIRPRTNASIGAETCSCLIGKTNRPADYPQVHDVMIPKNLICILQSSTRQRITHGR